MKVLLIDDEDDIRRIATVSLSAIGKHTVMQASRAVEGLALARLERPDVVLLDMMMPGIDGLGTLALMQADPELKGIPVLFMTAKVQRAEIDHYLAVGALGVIQKPFDPMTLSSEIERIMNAE